MKFSYLSGFFLLFLLISCTHKDSKKKTVLAIPVYGQSLALGEEAIRITNFDSLTEQCQHLVVTENLDEKFGFFSNTEFKQWFKKKLNDQHRSFELSIYGMAEEVTHYLQSKGYGDSVLLCTFPGGNGETGIKELSKGSPYYQKFIDEISGAYERAKEKGWDFNVPAFCWMQGENDIVWNNKKDYKKDLKQFQIDLNKDIKAITHQSNSVVCICYQTNFLGLSKDFQSTRFDAKETLVPDGQMELIKEDSLFMASGPTYPYTFVNEGVHIDGLSQKRIGHLAGLSVIRLLESQTNKGLIPGKFIVLGNTVEIEFNVPTLPLVLDTAAVLKEANYGFSVIDTGNNNILLGISIKDNKVILQCSKAPNGCKVRYAVNGSKAKNGREYGPRGNLRDSQGEKLITTIQSKTYPLHNWCYQFDEVVN